MQHCRHRLHMLRVPLPQPDWVGHNLRAMHQEHQRSAEDHSKVIPRAFQGNFKSSSTAGTTRSRCVSACHMRIWSDTACSFLCNRLIHCVSPCFTYYSMVAPFPCTGSQTAAVTSAAEQ